MTTPQPDAAPATRREPRLSAFFSPITDPGGDGDRGDHRELENELEREQEDLRRAIILDQRGRRALLVSIAALIAFAAGHPGRSATLLLIGVWLLFLVFVLALPAVLSSERSASPRSARWLAPATITADLLVAGAVFAVTEPARLAYLFLLAAILLVWVAGFHFSWRLAAYASVVSVAIYVMLARSGEAQWRLSFAAIAVNLAAFAAIAGLLTFELARYRARLDQLRLFCRQVGEGDLGVRLPFTWTPSDDVTSLGHGIDSMRKRLAEQIGVDALTGCLNRRALESRLRGEWRLARRRAGTIGLLALDLDRFKEINDVHGHAVGDAVLQQLAGIMRNVARESDIVARLGGDEFIMVLPDTHGDGAHVVAERLRQHVAEFEFGTRETPIRVTVSIGVAVAHGQDAISTAEILTEADRALYASKQAGRNRVSLGREYLGV